VDWCPTGFKVMHPYLVLGTFLVRNHKFPNLNAAISFPL
jgi:hypothetical protein